MSKPKKKRFNNASQIREEIDRYKAKMQKYNNAAMALDMKADSLAKDGQGFAGEISYSRSEALRQRKAAARILERRLPYLKQKLSEIMTPQLPTLVTEDKSINA